MTNILCVIIARAGSVGLPNKNALPVAGKPMLAWTLEHAKGARCLDHIVLSTDGEKLMAIGQRQGIACIKRPAELASNTATVDAAARHAVETVETQSGNTFSHIVLLYGNIPVRPTDLTDRAVSKLLETGADSVQSVRPVDKNHPFWMKKVDADDGDRLLMYEENNVYRRQDLPPVYMLDGGMIATTRKSLFNVVEGEPHAFLGKDRRAVITEPNTVIDVDSHLDLLVAETVLKEKLKAEAFDMKKVI